MLNTAQPEREMPRKKACSAIPEREREPPGIKDGSILTTLCRGVSEWPFGASTGALDEVEAVTFMGGEMSGSPSEGADGCTTLRAMSFVG